MAIYQFQRGKGYAHNVIDHFNYIRRDEKYKNYEKDKQQVEYVEHKFYPSNCTPKEFWENAEHYERVNGLVYHKFQFALPHELSKYEHIDLVRDFCKNNFEDYPHTMVIHNDPKTNNPHAHIMVCPRKNDGIEREPSQYFKRYNSKNQENGGFKKSDHFNDLGHYYEIRRSWEQTLNKELEKNGIEKVSCRSLRWQIDDAIKNGEYAKAEKLKRERVNLDGEIYKKYKDGKYLNKFEKERVQEFENARREKWKKEKQYEENRNNENSKYDKDDKNNAKDKYSEYGKSDSNYERKNENKREHRSDSSKSIYELRKELKKFKSMTEETTSAQVKNQLTKGEYYKLGKEIKQIKDFMEENSSTNNSGMERKLKELEERKNAIDKKYDGSYELKQRVMILLKRRNKRISELEKEIENHPDRDKWKNQNKNYENKNETKKDKGNEEFSKSSGGSGMNPKSLNDLKRALENEDEEGKTSNSRATFKMEENTYDI